jgi:hypothetical protein
LNNQNAKKIPMLMTAQTGCTTTVAVITAAATAGAAIAYLASASTNTAFGTLVLEFLRATGTIRNETPTNKESADPNTNKQKDEWKDAFVSWIESEENNDRSLQQRGTNSEGEDLNDPLWMTDVVQNSFRSAVLRTPSEEFERCEERVISHSSNCDDAKGFPLEEDFRRTFRFLQEAISNMVRREPSVREDFFNGVMEKEPTLFWTDEDRDCGGRLRSLSVSSTSTSSSFTDPYAYLVEDEDSVERLIKYLRLVQFAEEEARRTRRSVRSLSGGRKQGKRIPDLSGYELLGSENATSIKMGYFAAINRKRKDLVIAVHHHQGSSVESDRDRIQNTLAANELLQNDSEDTRLEVLDEAVQCLSEEIIRRYLEQMDGKEKDPSSLPPGNKLVVCGHSLGAASACRLGAVLKHKLKDLPSLHCSVQVYAYGPPPFISTYPIEDDSYITSVINNHDCIPRWTKNNIQTVRKLSKWMMHRKALQFRTFFSKSHHPSKFIPGIPPFSLSSKDWDGFWKANRREADDKFRIPGRVICIWNHSQDPMIIGAKVHRSSLPHYIQSNHCRTDRVHDVVKRLWVNESMFRDHTIDAYRSNLELLLGQVANTI